MSWRSPSSAPSRSRPRPAPGWLGRSPRARPAWSACTTRTPGRSAKGAPASRSSSATRLRSPTTTMASSSTTASNTAPPRTPRSCSRSGTHPPARWPRATHGHRRPRLRPSRHRARPARPGRAHRRDPPPGQDLTRPQDHREHSRGFRELVKWRTGSEGRISYLKRGYGWDRTRLDSRQGAAIWCGHGVFAHNLIKIGAMAS